VKSSCYRLVRRKIRTGEAAASSATVLFHVPYAETLRIAQKIARVGQHTSRADRPKINGNLIDDEFSEFLFIL